MQIRQKNVIGNESLRFWANSAFIRSILPADFFVLADFLFEHFVAKIRKKAGSAKLPASFLNYVRDYLITFSIFTVPSLICFFTMTMPFLATGMR